MDSHDVRPNDDDDQLDPSLRAGSTPADVAARVATDRIAPRSLVSEDGRAFAVNALLEAGAERHYADILAAVAAARGRTESTTWATIAASS